MGVHEDTLQGLQEALEYTRGDRTKGRSTIVTIPDDDMFVKYNQLDEKDKYIIRGMIERLSVLSSR